MQQNSQIWAKKRISQYGYLKHSKRAVLWNFSLIPKITRIGEKNWGVIIPKTSEQKIHTKNNSIEAINRFWVFGFWDFTFDIVSYSDRDTFERPRLIGLTKYRQENVSPTSTSLCSFRFSQTVALKPISWKQIFDIAKSVLENVKYRLKLTNNF